MEVIGIIFLTETRRLWLPALDQKNVGIEDIGINQRGMLRRRSCNVFNEIPCHLMLFMQIFTSYERKINEVVFDGRSSFNGICII